jgi:hypothetical protein
MGSLFDIEKALVQHAYLSRTAFVARASLSPGGECGASCLLNKRFKSYHRNVFNKRLS